jgi:IS5 family transposase
LKIVQDHHRKYDGIDLILESNPKILDAFHDDLKDYGSMKGRESKFCSEQILRLALVKGVEGDPYREAIIRVDGSDFLRNFCRFGMGELPNFTFFSEAMKCIKPETLKAMNMLLLEYGKEKGLVSGKSLRLDSTVSESNIHYPTDAHLLWDGYRTLARMMTQARKADWRLDCGNRLHTRKAKSLFTFVSTHGGKKNKSTKRKVDKKMRTLVERVDWIVEIARKFSKHAGDVGCNSIAAYGIVGEIERMIPKVAHVALQARRAWINGETVSAAERIFSIFEDHTELLMRGKARKPIEFGHLVTLGQTQEKFISYYTVEERSRHDSAYKDEVLEDHKNKFKSYPDCFTADKNYHVSMEDTRNWEKEIDLYAVGKKGNRSIDEEHREHTEEFRLAQRFRAGCEGSISVLKRAFGLKRVLNRGFKSFAAAIGCLVFCHNLVLLALP